LSLGTLDPAALDALRQDFHGKVLADGGPGYEDARSIFNAMIARRPAAIAQCEDAGDIRAALAFARANNADLGVRGGGHSVAGACLIDGGLTIDLRRMNRVSVDPEARVATVGGGATWRDFDTACDQYDLAATGGRVSATGVAGLSLGGGSGWLERKFGLACDNLLSVELVTGDGRTVLASEEENPELFWALHGGGGNFGIATELKLHLYPLPTFTAALMIWPPDAAPELVRAYRDFAKGALADVGGAVTFLTGPPADFVPESLHNRLALAILVTYTGPEAEARAALAPLLDREPAGTMIRGMPYLELQSMLGDRPGYRNYWSTEYLNELTDEGIDAFCARAGGIIVPSPTQHVIFPWGGAVARRAADWPVANRDASWVVHPLTIWEDPADDERAIQWARDVCADVEPWASGASHARFAGGEAEERIVAAYGREDYDRLVAVKAQYDPDDVFRLHDPARPAATS
jgi:FAD/FMN-containing dehydrogenase